MPARHARLIRSSLSLIVLGITAGNMNGGEPGSRRLQKYVRARS